MKQFITLVSTLLLTLTLLCVKTTAQTQGMYDIPIFSKLINNGTSFDIWIERKTTIHRQVRFTVPAGSPCSLLTKTQMLVSVF